MIGATFSQSHYDLYKETGDQNLFEEVVDKMVMDEHLDLDQDVKDYIMSEETRENKRLFILTNLLKDNSNEIAESFIRLKNHDTRIEHLKDALLTLKHYIEVGQQEVKKYGEVFTPLSLVKEMVATLPEEVWSNPNLKWLDPANGMGNFPLIVIYKLMKGLKYWEPNPEKRYKHIIENMIYVCELQPRNAFMYLSLVDPNDEYDVNLYCGSFLDEGFDYHMKTVWKMDEFDIVMGNPPYQEQKPGYKKTQPIWNLFVKKSISVLNECGYLTMIHPSGWRNVDGIFKDVQNLLTSRKILELHIHDERDGIRVFGADTRYDFYCMKNEICDNFESKIRCQDGSIESVNLSNLEFIPNGGFSKILSLMTSKYEERTTVLYSRSIYGTDKTNVSKEKSEIFKYPVVYTVPKGDTLNLMYSSCNDRGHFGQPKLIWSNGRIISVGKIGRAHV